MAYKLTYKNGKTMFMSNGLLTGDTYEFKSEIKSDFRGMWLPDQKAWAVDEAIVLDKIENSIFTSRLSNLTVEQVDAGVQPQQPKAKMSQAQYYDLITEGHGKDW